MADNSPKFSSGEDEDQWIEMNNVQTPTMPHRSPHRSPQPDTATRPLPQLKLDTSNLSPPHHRELSVSERSAMHSEDGDTPPQSAILGLAANLTNSQWLPHGASNQESKQRLTADGHSQSPGACSRSINESMQSPSPSFRGAQAEDTPFASDDDDLESNKNIPRLVLNVQRSFETTGDVTDEEIRPDTYRMLTQAPTQRQPSVDRPRNSTNEHADGATLRNEGNVDRSYITRNDHIFSTQQSSPQSFRSASVRRRSISPHRRLGISPSSPVSQQQGHTSISSGSPNSRRHRNSQLLSPSVHRQPGGQHLSLSGAAITAQRDFLEAEESNQTVNDIISDRESLAGTSLHDFPNNTGIGIGQIRSDLEYTASHSPPPSILQSQTADDASVMVSSIEPKSVRSDQFVEPMGRSLFYFTSDNKLRRILFQVVRSEWCRYLMILLTFVHIVALCVEQGPTYSIENGAAVIMQPRFVKFYVALYSVFSLVIVMECIAFGIFTNEALSVEDVKERIKHGWRMVFFFITLGAVKKPRNQYLFQDPLTVHKCVLRTSWGRVEAISIIFFWVFIGISAGGYVKSLELFISGIGHLRVMRVLDYISYTRTVLQVIKTAIPFLQNVIIFIAFFISIWTLIGVQSFNGSLRRVCIYGEIITSQHCGSWLNPDTLDVEPYMRLDSRYGTYQSQSAIKGYTCPAGSICVELKAFPPSGSFAELSNESFDNIFNALEIVLILMSNNGFTDILYKVIDSEYLVSSLFFISGVLVLGIWLMNLLVAVMVSSYAAVKRTLNQAEPEPDRFDRLRDWIRKKLTPKHYSSDLEHSEMNSKYSDSDHEDSRVVLQHGNSSDIFISKSDGFVDQPLVRKWYSAVHLIFTLLAIVDLIVQACLTAPENNLLPWEAFLTAAFGVEFVLRFIAYYPNWRFFLSSATTFIDIILVIANIVTLIFYHNKEIYSWLTAFQLLRIYRLVGAIKYSRVFWLQIFGNFNIFASLTAFYFASTLLATLIAAKMLRGQFPLHDDSGAVNMFSFYDLAASFFSMYQVSSTENWTDVLFWTTNNVSRTGGNVAGLACIGILLFGWLFFANFLVLNLFIGVMSENLHGLIGNKREEQVRRFAEEISNTEKDTSGSIFRDVLTTMDASQTPYTEDFYIEEDRHVTMRDRLWGFVTRIMMWNPKGRSVVNPIRAAVEQKFVLEFLESNGGLSTILKDAQEPKRTSTFLSLNDTDHSHAYYGRYPLIKNIRRQMIDALGYLHHYPPQFRMMLRQSFEKRHNQALANSSAAFVEAMFDTKEHALSVLNKYCESHPNFDKSLFLFSINNPIRRFCQRIFASSNGIRRSKIVPGKWVHLIVRLFFMAATICLVVLTCVNTPLEAMNQKRDSGKWTIASWYDLAFGCILLVEFLGKVIADGFHFTPNAYTWSMWNNVDLIVLISIWMTFINDTLNGPLSRYVRALMALRALRLLGFYSDNFRVLNSAFRHGLRNILGAVIIMMTIVIPYSVWGKNIFHDRLSHCNDGDIDYFADCSGEFINTVFDNFEVLSPRATTGNYFDYDNFWHALLIQFGVLSLEGWVDVLQAVSSISSSGEQSTNFASKGNALYPILYNYIGTVLIITMLIAVIIRNYAIITGTAFLTEQQLSWLDVKRTLGFIKPTPRPPKYKYGSLRAQLLSIMPTWIQSIEILTLLVATVNLASYFYPLKPSTEKIYQLIQVGCSTVLVSLAVIRLIVLRPALFFHNWWNPFGLIVCLLVMVLTIVILVEPYYKISGVDGVSRAAVIAMLLLWIPRTKRLYQFYSIGTAALKEISVLLRAWFTLYIAYAIALNQSFGLTKLGSQSTWTKNFRTIPKALIALFFMSCGEGWNEYLMDFVIAKPYCLETSKESECGIPGFAYFLFISWNIVSMYVFANLFISLICEGCWYVYRSGPVNINELDIVHLLESWQQFDPRGAGLIRTRDLYKFLGRSQGYFSIGIFSPDPVYNVHRILAETNADVRTVIDPYDVDYEAIYQYLADMPVRKYREIRILYELFTTQARLISEPIPGGNGIRFSKLVLMFPLYKDMNPAESLSLKEFIELKAKLYEASIILAAEFIATTWRAKKQTRRNRVYTSSSVVTSYSEELINQE